MSEEELRRNKLKRKSQGRIREKKKCGGEVVEESCKEGEPIVDEKSQQLAAMSKKS